jgi:hypothetical protein
MTTPHEAILERIGHTLAEIDTAAACEKMPETLLAFMQQPCNFDHSNILCALVQALTEPKRLTFVERDGELYIYSHE